MSSCVSRRVMSAIAAGVLALSGLAAVTPRAYADGDPASDVLATQRLFVPADATVVTGEQLQLTALLNEAAGRGYPLRVAIVASRTDLGSVTALWRRPETYARFLGGELALVFHGTVLVVMPNGYGTDVTASGVRTASGEAELPVPRAHLGSAAIAAVERFASGAGIRLVSPTVSSRPVAHPTAVLPWIVLVLGVLALSLAWGTSLRRRPIRLRAGNPF
jgi:hypothetical protein